MGILTDDMRRVVESELGFIATVCPDGKGWRFKGTAAVRTSGETFERGIEFYEARGTVDATEEELREHNLGRLTDRVSPDSPGFAD